MRNKNNILFPTYLLLNLCHIPGCINEPVMSQAAVVHWLMYVTLFSNPTGLFLGSLLHQISQVSKS